MSEQEVSQEVTKEQQEQQQQELVRAVYPYARRLMLEQNMDTRGRELLMEKGLGCSKKIIHHISEGRGTIRTNHFGNASKRSKRCSNFAICL